MQALVCILSSEQYSPLSVLLHMKRLAYLDHNIETISQKVVLKIMSSINQSNSVKCLCI
jgi:hypothetical protein